MEIESQVILEKTVKSSSLDVLRAAVQIVLRLEEEISKHAITHKCWEKDRENLRNIERNKL